MKKSILFLICSTMLIALNGCTGGRAVFSHREISDASDTLESVGVETDNSEFSGFGEVAEDIKSKTDTLFRIQYITSDDI